MKKFIIVIFGFFLSLAFLDAQSRTGRLKPQWLRSRPICKDQPNILFVPVTVDMPNTNFQEQVRRNIYNSLPAGWRQEVNYSDKQTNNLDPAMKDGRAVLEGDANIQSESVMTADGEIIHYRSMLIDEFVYRHNGTEQYSALYQVIPSEGISFKTCHVTDKYGAAGTLLSIVPGVGQFYKGDALKGSLFMGGCVLGGVGIVFTEMQRKAYISQIAQTHDINVIKQLDANQKNMGIARNVCIGVTAALYVWNIFDAAIAPGARRVKITNKGFQYNF